MINKCTNWKLFLHVYQCFNCSLRVIWVTKQACKWVWVWCAAPWQMHKHVALRADLTVVSSSTISFSYATAECMSVNTCVCLPRDTKIQKTGLWLKVCVTSVRGTKTQLACIPGHECAHCDFQNQKRTMDTKLMTSRIVHVYGVL